MTILILLMLSAGVQAEQWVGKPCGPDRILLPSLSGEGYRRDEPGDKPFVYKNPLTSNVLTINIPTTDGFILVASTSNYLATQTGITARNGLAVATFSASKVSVFAAFRALGSLTAPAAVTANTILGVLSARGFNGTVFHSASAAAIGIYADENFTSTAGGGRLVITTVPNGSTTPLERVRVDNQGRMGIGVTNPAERLDVAGTVRAEALKLTSQAGVGGRIPCYKADGSLGRCGGVVNPGLFNCLPCL